MTLDLNKLSNKLDEALSNETSETLTKFLNNKRMKNETNKITLTNTTATTTATTFLCNKFTKAAITGATEPRCTRCGKFSYQHPIISNTL